MVYDGTPSRGCQTCRKRRIKCDTVRPTCGQCLRSKRECLGYRDENGLFFRNETHVTELRVKRFENRKKMIEKREKESSRDGSNKDVALPESLVLFSRVGTPSNVPPAISFPVDLEAITGFMENFVLSSRHPKCAPGHLKYLPMLYQKATLGSALSLSTAALALAARTLFTEYRQEYTNLAWRTYGSAISKLNEDLRDPIKARRNETLMATMLFGATESLLATPAPKYARSRHIDGAIALLRLRGKELIEDEVSTSLYLTVRTHMILDRVQRARPTEMIFYNKDTGWQHKLTEKVKSQNVNTTLTQYMILMPALRTRANQLLQQPFDECTTKEITDFIKECKLFDTMLGSWPATIPADWQYSSVARHDEDPLDGDYENSELFPGDIDVYYDGWVACVWNSWRCSRMFVNAIILRCVLYLTPADTDVRSNVDYLTAKETLQMMVDQVCSGVPFHIGYKPPKIPKDGLLSPDGVQGLRMLDPKALAAYFSLWPLFVARSAITVPTKQREWLRGRMMAILYRFGTVHAKMLVDIGDKDEKRPLFADHWDASMFENIFESSNLYASGGV